jgi:kynurenine formamidase
MCGVTADGVMRGSDPELHPEPLIEKDGLQVSKSPWGADDEIGRLNWITQEGSADIIGRLAGTKVFDLAVTYFLGMPSWTEAGDPPFDQWMTHTPHGTIVDGRSGYDGEIHKTWCYSGDAISMYTHCGTHIDTLNHMGYHLTQWNGWTPEKHLGSKAWTKCGSDQYPPIFARGVLLDIAALQGVDVVEDNYGITAQDLKDAAKRQGTELRKGDVVIVHTGCMAKWPDQSYVMNSPGIDLSAARWLCEEAGTMAVGSDNIGLEQQPYFGEYAPVHCYMFATCGAQIIEVINSMELAAEQVYEFAFLGFPMKIVGATGAPMPCVAVPMR